MSKSTSISMSMSMSMSKSKSSDEATKKTTTGFPLELAKKMSTQMCIVSVPFSTFHLLRGGRRGFLDGLPASLRIGRNIALCGGVQLSAAHIRRKDDAWNTFLAGAALVAVRHKEAFSPNALLRLGGVASVAVAAGAILAASEVAMR